MKRRWRCDQKEVEANLVKSITHTLIILIALIQKNF